MLLNAKVWDSLIINENLENLRASTQSVADDSALTVMKAVWKILIIRFNEKILKRVLLFVECTQAPFSKLFVIKLSLTSQINLVNFNMHTPLNEKIMSMHGFTNSASFN